jgi:hypothetical protein
VAFLVRPWIVTYVDADGRRCKKGTPGARKVRERASKWYGCAIPGLPPRKRVPLAQDKRSALKLLDKLVEKAERGRAGCPTWTKPSGHCSPIWATSRRTCAPAVPRARAPARRRSG